MKAHGVCACESRCRMDEVTNKRWKEGGTHPQCHVLALLASCRPLVWRGWMPLSLLLWLLLLLLAQR